MLIPKKISHAIDEIARTTVGKDWTLYAALLEHWQEIVGTDFAQIATPIKISFPHQPQQSQRNHGTLLVRLPKGLAMEFSFKTEQIRQRINSYFGYEAFARITYESVVQPTQSRRHNSSFLTEEALAEIDTTLKDIENGELRQALEGFGKALLAKKPTES